MALKDLVERIRNALQRGQFTSEAAVCQGILLPLLNELGWPVFDTHIVWPEYTAGGGRVDYALCSPSDCPVIFIEAKRVGQIEGADRQLFEYAFHQGVPMAVLTDGQEWHFYLPAEQGHYEERRVYKLDLLERDLDECVNRLQRYLGHDAVSSGEALNYAKADYRDINRVRQIQKTLPQAWKQLLENPEDLLSEYLAEKVEDICGYKPDLDIFSRFIRTEVSASDVGSSTQRKKDLGKIGAKKSPVTDYATRVSRTGYAFHGQFHPCGSAREVMIKVLQEFDRQDSSFLDRLSSRKHGRKRRYVAKDKYELYPGRPDLADNHYFKLKPGWYVGTNYSRQVISNIIHLACDVASIDFGSDLKTELG